MVNEERIADLPRMAYFVGWVIALGGTDEHGRS
jgi:hypothetical protein